MWADRTSASSSKLVWPSVGLVDASGDVDPGVLLRRSAGSFCGVDLADVAAVNSNVYKIKSTMS